MASVRINVGAASDGSMRTVFKPLVEAAKEAVTQVKAAFKGIGVGAGDAFKDVPGAAAKATSAVEREAKRAADTEAREAKRAAKEKERALEHVFQIKQKYLQQEEREASRSMAKQAAEQQKHAERTGYWSMRYMDRTMRAAGGFAMNMAKSAGVNLDLGSMIGKSVEMGKMAQDLSNASYQPGAKGAAGTRVEASVLASEATRAGQAAALDPNKALEGMRNFVSTTGDLETARAVIGDLGILSRATGTDFDDMVTAAGEVSAKLGDIPNKGHAVIAVMRGLAGQGKLGAVEIRNVAKEMANVGASAGAFTGKAEDNMIIIGAMMQEARQRGGAKTASVAANAVSSFTSYVQSTKGIKNLAAGGVQPWADEGHTKLLNPETIILAALMKSGGDMGKLGAMFRDKMSMRAVTGFARVYSEAGGGQENKLNAVRAEFEKLKSAAMGEGEVMDAFNKSMATPEAQIQLFNNRLQEVGGQIAAKLLPSLISLGPAIISGVDAFGRLVAWATENPGKMLAAALAASIARAQIETVIRSGIESLLKSAMGGGGSGVAGSGGPDGGGAVGAMSAAGSAIAIAATAVTIASVGMLVIDKLAGMKDKAAEKDINDEFAASNARADVIGGIMKGGLTNEEVAALQKNTDEIDARIAATKAPKSALDNYGGTLFSSAVNWTTFGEYGTSGAASDRLSRDTSNVEGLESQSAMNHAALERAIANAMSESQGGFTDKMRAALMSGVMKVQVVGGGMPMVGDKGRSK